MNDISYECRSGQPALIEEAKQIINEYNADHLDSIFSIEFIQIKEKFCGLRLYLNHYSEEITDKIRELEKYNKHYKE